MCSTSMYIFFPKNFGYEITIRCISIQPAVLLGGQQLAGF